MSHECHIRYCDHGWREPAVLPAHLTLGQRLIPANWMVFILKAIVAAPAAVCEILLGARPNEKAAVLRAAGLGRVLQAHGSHEKAVAGPVGNGMCQSIPSVDPGTSATKE